jgi:uncharacterized Zn finger protein
VEQLKLFRPRLGAKRCRNAAERTYQTRGTDAEACAPVRGRPAFARGEAYPAEGKVEILTLGPDRIAARAFGSEVYRCESADGLASGICTCLGQVAAGAA